MTNPNTEHPNEPPPPPLGMEIFEVQDTLRKMGNMLTNLRNNAGVGNQPLILIVGADSPRFSISIGDPNDPENLIVSDSDTLTQVVVGASHQVFTRLIKDGPLSRLFGGSR